MDPSKDSLMSVPQMESMTEKVEQVLQWLKSVTAALKEHSTDHGKRAATEPTTASMTLDLPPSPKRPKPRQTAAKSKPKAETEAEAEVSSLLETPSLSTEAAEAAESPALAIASPKRQNKRQKTKPVSLPIEASLSAVETGATSDAPSEEVVGPKTSRPAKPAKTSFTNGMLVFISEIRTAYETQHPSKSKQEVWSDLGVRWKQLEPAIKSKYTAIAQELNAATVALAKAADPKPDADVGALSSESMTPTNVATTTTTTPVVAPGSSVSEETPKASKLKKAVSSTTLKSPLTSRPADADPQEPVSQDVIQETLKDESSIKPKKKQKRPVPKTDHVQPLQAFDSSQPAADAVSTDPLSAINPSSSTAPPPSSVTSAKEDNEALVDSSSMVNSASLDAVAPLSSQKKSKKSGAQKVSSKTDSASLVSSSQTSVPPLQDKENSGLQMDNISSSAPPHAPPSQAPSKKSKVAKKKDVPSVEPSLLSSPSKTLQVGTTAPCLDDLLYPK